MPKGDYPDCEYCICLCCDSFDLCEIGLENCDDCDLMGAAAIDKCTEV